MTDHDPYCESADLDCPRCDYPTCACELLARVRADERERGDKAAGAALWEAIHQRDAARAEVAALRADYIADYEDHATWAARIRREVLADLPAQVLALPERADAHTEECPGRPGYRGICTCEGDILISRAAVLALLDEAGR